MSHVKRKLFSFFCSTRRDAKTCFTLSRSQVIILCFLLVIGTIFLALFSLNLFCSTATFQRSAQKILVFWREKNQIYLLNLSSAVIKKNYSLGTIIFPFFRCPQERFSTIFHCTWKPGERDTFPKNFIRNSTLELIWVEKIRQLKSLGVNFSCLFSFFSILHKFCDEDICRFIIC